MKWIKFSKKKPPIDEDVLIWVAGDFNYFDIGYWNGNENDFCHGWETSNELSKYRPITHLAKPIKPPKN